MSGFRERDSQAVAAAAGLDKNPRPPLDFEAEDEKENDRHRWRARQSRDDPGAKACEATCIFCVGMLFLQVGTILSRAIIGALCRFTACHAIFSFGDLPFLLIFTSLFCAP